MTIFNNCQFISYHNFISKKILILFFFQKNFFKKFFLFLFIVEKKIFVINFIQFFTHKDNEITSNEKRLKFFSLQQCELIKI